METSRLDLLRRQNLGAARRARMQQDLLRIGIPDQHTIFLPLEESDRVRQIAGESFEARNKKPSGVIERQLPLAKKGGLTDIIPPSSGDVYVIPSAAEIVGVLKLPANILNAKWTHLVELNPDGFVVINSECNLKIVVQVIDDSGSGEEELDIAAWGDLWCQHLKQLK